MEEKEKEIDLLQKKLSELQRKADPKIPNIPDHSVVHPLGQINAPQQAAVVNTPPVAIEQPTIASPVQALEEKLAIIQVPI